MTDNLILKVFYTTRLRRTIINKFERNLSKYPNICRYLENRYACFFSYRETLNKIYNKIEEQPICKYCGTPISSISGSSFCCNEHKILCRKEISKQTCLEKYGVDNVSKIPGLMKSVAKKVDYSKRQEKMKETLLNKYGVDNPGKLQSTIDSSHTVDVINKQKESREITCLNKYGCKNSMQADISKESYKQTCLEKYGVDNYFKTQEFKDKLNWGINNFKTKLDPNGKLYINYNINLFNSELQYYNNSNGNYNITYKNSDIIKYYQQDVFYKNEKELCDDNNIKGKLIYNRTSYLNKSINELTVEDILSGFKISGIYYGYSSFNPLWFKKFIEDNNIKICYDPCGGWGHRLLEGQLLEKYIYNDLSIDTYNNVNKIIHDLNIQNTITYNNDATVFVPNENYDAIFTCPPYYNIEEYSCGKFNSIDDYDKLIDNIFNCFYNKESCKILGIVIREDLLPNKFKVENHRHILIKVINYIKNIYLYIVNSLFLYK